MGQGELVIAGLIALVIAGLIALVVGIIMIVWGILIFYVGDYGFGLMVIGGGMIIGDFGGFLIFKNAYVLIGGGAGAVVLVLGWLARVGPGR